MHVIETVDEEGNPKYQVVRNFSWVSEEMGYSVNDLINVEDFPTEWGTASRIADLESLYFFLLNILLVWFFLYAGFDSPINRAILLNRGHVAFVIVTSRTVHENSLGADSPGYLFFPLWRYGGLVLAMLQGRFV